MSLCYDAPMEKEDILHLARLSRIAIDDAEASALVKDIDAVLAYVSEVNSITAEAGITKKVGARYNIFREDAVTTAEGEYTEALLKEAPKRKDNYLQVKKILQTD